MPPRYRHNSKSFLTFIGTPRAESGGCDLMLAVATRVQVAQDMQLEQYGVRDNGCNNGIV